MTADLTSEEALRARVAELEGELEARDKTIDALMARVEGAFADRSEAFTLFEQNVALERIIAARTRELSEQGARLERALDELRHAQSRLVQAQKLEAIGSLAAGVAHEINTPVQYVSDNVTFLGRAFTQMSALCATVTGAVASGADADILRGTLERATKKAKLDYLRAEVPRAIEQAGDGLARITSIVSAMKELSHRSSGDKEMVDLARAIETTLTVSQNEWRYVADVETSFDPALPPVPALRNELNQVLLNLIVNAAQAIEDALRGRGCEKGLIRISTRAQGDFARIEVSDTGTGIPEPIRDRIFDPFFTTKPVGKGSGQGLAVVHNVVVDRHGGRIDVETQIDRGSTFIMSLPITGHPPPDAAADALVDRAEVP